jgi:hypothetical protein
MDAALCATVKAEWELAQSDPTSVVITPLVLELIAERR